MKFLEKVDTILEKRFRSCESIKKKKFNSVESFEIIFQNFFAEF